MIGVMNKISTNKLFRIESFPYRVLEVQVDNRMKDKNYTDIVNIIHSLMKDIKKRVVCNKDGIVYTKCQPISFEILYNSNKEITFNFAINELDSLYFKNRLQAILPNSTLTFRDDYINEFKNSTMYNYQYDKHYMLSLNTKISPIQSLLAIKKDLNDNEKLLLQTLILPIGDMWKNNCYDNWNKIRKGQDVTNNNILLTISNFAIDIFNEFFSIVDDILEANPKSEINNMSVSKRLMSEFNSDSKTKTNNDGFKININSFIKSSNDLQCYNIGKSIETSYKDMTLDNNLKISRKKKTDINRIIPLFNKTIMSSVELANLIKLPDNILQRRFNIKSIRINQIDVPKECRKGFVKLGELEFHGDVIEWFLPTDRDTGSLAVIMITKQGGGKTTLQLNIANDAIKHKEGLVAIDYVRNNQFSQGLIKMYPDIKVVRFDNINDLDNFSFPEVEIDESSTPFERKVQANIIAIEVRYLLDSMATDSEPLTRIMSKYLSSACKVVFVYKNKTLLDVLNVLEDKNIRDEFISRVINDGIFTLDSREIKNLKELDNNTAYSRLQGLFDRFSVITDDTILNEMLESRQSKVNFVDIMDNSKPIVIVMPQNIFTNKYSKDVLCTYYMSRVRLAMSKRKDFNKICRVIIDEVHQIPKTMNLIKDTIAEPRKFAVNYILSMHSFGQLDKDIKDSLTSIGCHFMLLKGVDEKGFSELKPYIGDEFEYEDMKEMDWDYGSLNLINIKNEYRVFMSKLPDPLKDSRGKLFIGD